MLPPSSGQKNKSSMEIVVQIEMDRLVVLITLVVIERMIKQSVALKKVVYFLNRNLDEIMALTTWHHNSLFSVSYDPFSCTPTELIHMYLNIKAQ
jgi:hypothetical protein